MLMQTFLALFGYLTAIAADDGLAKRPAPETLDLPGLICFWDFQEAGGDLRQARGLHNYALREHQGKIARVQGGVCGPYSARIEQGQWLSIDRDDCPGLMIERAFSLDARKPWLAEALYGHMNVHSQ